MAGTTKMKLAGIKWPAFTFQLTIINIGLKKLTILLFSKLHPFPTEGHEQSMQGVFAENRQA